MNKIKKFFKRLTPEPEYVLNLEKAPEYIPMTSQLPEDYTVKIVEHFDDEGRRIGSSIEPPLSSIVNASDLDRLRWKAATANAAHPELRLAVREGHYAIAGERQNGYFNLTYGGYGGTGGFFDTMWTKITGLSMGADIVKRHLETEIKKEIFLNDDPLDS